jgi:hypothetical protein
MKIGGVPNNNDASTGSSQVRRQAGKADARSVSVNTPASSSMNESLKTESTELARLAAELKRIPEVREQQVIEATERFESGYYLTQEAAEQTADRLTS